jgi:hypothetical protein
LSAREAARAKQALLEFTESSSAQYAFLIAPGLPPSIILIKSN